MPGSGQMSAGLWQVSLDAEFWGVFYKAPATSGSSRLLLSGLFPRVQPQIVLYRHWGPLRLRPAFRPCLGSVTCSPQRQGHHPVRLLDSQNCPQKHPRAAEFLTGGGGVEGMGDSEFLPLSRHLASITMGRHWLQDVRGPDAVCLLGSSC